MDNSRVVNVERAAPVFRLLLPSALTLSPACPINACHIGGPVEVVRAAGLEPAQRLLTEGFSYLLRLSPPSPTRSCQGSVWGLDYTFTLARAL